MWLIWSTKILRDNTKYSRKFFVINYQYVILQQNWGHCTGTLPGFFGFYQHTKVVLYLLYIQPEISFNYCIIA